MEEGHALQCGDMWTTQYPEVIRYGLLSTPEFKLNRGRVSLCKLDPPVETVARGIKRISVLE